jgi:hypothetical protein
MADNVTLPGTGAAIATDEVAVNGGSSAQVQYVKLVDGTANGTAGIPGDSSGLVVKQATAASLNCTEASASAIKTAVELLDDAVFADDAAFTVGTSKVQVVGGVTVAHGSSPDAADAGDAVAPLYNRHRVQFTIGGHPNVVTVKHTDITTAVTDAAIVTVAAGSKIVVTRLTVTLDSASTVFPLVRIGFGTANTPTTTGVIASHGGVPAGGGFTIGDGSGIIGIGADDADLRVTTTGNATGNGLHITCSYFVIES